MKYTTEEALTEILRRKDAVVLRRSRRSCRALTGAAGALLAALAVVIGLVPGGAPAPAGAVYGAFLLSREAGGYVLAAVIAFALGVVITLLCLARRKQATHRKERK